MTGSDIFSLDDVLDEALRKAVPSSCIDDLQVALLGRGIRLRLDRALDGGFTDARVLVVLSEHVEHGARKVILKIDRVGDSSTEAEIHAAACAVDPDFTARHLVDQPIPSIDLGEWKAMFQSIAGGSLADYRTLSAILDTTAVPDIAGTVCESILNRWQPMPSHDEIEIGEFIRLHIRHKLDDAGSLTRWIMEQYGEGALNADVLRFADDPDRVGYVNPLAYARDPKRWPSDLAKIRIIVGNAHGDLHPGNILLPLPHGSPDASAFRLIDLSAYSKRAPLTLDPVNLMLSIVARSLPTDARARRHLRDVILRKGATNLPSAIAPICEIVDRVYAVGDEAMSGRGLTDEWRRQLLLSTMSNALVWASRDSLTAPDRVWFVELAAHAASALAPVVPASVFQFGDPLSVQRLRAQEVVADLSDACANFAGLTTTVALMSSGINETRNIASFAAAGWDLVIDFNPIAQESEAHVTSASQGVVGRLIQPQQSAVFARGTTTWLAAVGLAPIAADRDNPNIRVPMDFRAWRRTVLPHFRESVALLAAAYTTPATMVVFGEPGDRERAVMDELLDAFGDRLRLIYVGPQTNSLGSYAPEEHLVDARLTAEMFPQKSGIPSTKLTPTLPSGKDGEQRVEVDARQLAWFSMVGEVLHSGVGIDAEATYDPEAFYHGATISWFALSLNADELRQVPLKLYHDAVEQNLLRGGTRRLVMRHSPGAGGTTLARRIAWDERLSYPVLLCRSVADARPVADRIRELSRLTNRSVLVVLETTSEDVVNRLHSLLRADSVSVTILLVSRRSTLVAEQTVARAGRPPDIGPLDGSESVQFARLFAALAPDRRRELMELTNSVSRQSVPFLYALTAFEKDFHGLAEYVARSLANVNGTTADVIALIAIVHRYAGLAIPADVFSLQLGLPPNRPVDLERHLGDNVESLLLREATRWRTLHPLVAEETLRQLLTPSGANRLSGDSSEIWTTGLTSRCKLLIEWIFDAYQENLPQEIKRILALLFLERNSQGELGGNREDFSELVSVIPLAEGRLEVMRILAETFPSESHYWAHYARMLSYQANDYPAARNAIEHALGVDDNDATLHHIAGMIARGELFALMSTGSRAEGDYSKKFERVAALSGEGLREFDAAARLEDASEYPHVAAAQLCVRVIEWGFQQSGLGTYRAFLQLPRNLFFVELVDRAEDALDRVREITADDHPSARAQAIRVQLRTFYDDYSGLLEGWRNLLQRDDVAKGPIRRRLARTYRQREGGWRKAGRKAIQNAMDLLTDNLRDNPHDWASLRDWLGVARYTSASLDQAAEYVGYWASSERSRDALLYDYVLSALAAMDGRNSAIAQYERKVGLSRDRAAEFPNRRKPYEWLGTGDGLRRLVSNRDLEDWDRRDRAAEDPSLLQRVEGRVFRLSKPQSGIIDFGHGLLAFFQPAPVGLLAGQDENRRVSALIGFAYEGPQAWSVRPL